MDSNIESKIRQFISKHNGEVPKDSLEDTYLQEFGKHQIGEPVKMARITEILGTVEMCQELNHKELKENNEFKNIIINSFHVDWEHLWEFNGLRAAYQHLEANFMSFR